MGKCPEENVTVKWIFRECHVEGHVRTVSAIVVIGRVKTLEKSAFSALRGDGAVSLCFCRVWKGLASGFPIRQLILFSELKLRLAELT